MKVDNENSEVPDVAWTRQKGAAYAIPSVLLRALLSSSVQGLI
jgi:hypothetical protein